MADERRVAPDAARRYGALMRVQGLVVGAIAALALAAPATTQAAVLISEVQASDAEQPSREFVELVNTGPNAVDLTDWQLLLGGESCSPGVQISFPADFMLAVGQRALVAGQVELTPPVAGDLTFPDQDSVEDLGFVQLLRADTSTADLVGYGPALSCSEGDPAIAPEPGNSIARSPVPPMARADGTDTDDNATDFDISEPTPQNRALTVPLEPPPVDPEPPPVEPGPGPGPTPAPTPDPGPTPTPTPPPTPVDPLFAVFGAPLVTVDPPRPVAGQPASLVLVAVDPLAPISAFAVDPHGAGPGFGISACRRGLRARTTVEQRAPLVFTRPGRAVVTVAIRSGGCVAGRVQRRNLVVDVQAPAAARALRQAVPLPSGAPVPATGPVAGRPSAGCANADLRVTAATLRRATTALLCLVNAERRSLRRARLVRSSRLDAFALRHTRDMLKRRFFSHRGPGGPTYDARFRKLRYRGSLGENIVYHEGATARVLFEAWMGSPPHKANMLDRTFRFGGLGMRIGTPRGGRSGATVTGAFGTGR